MKSINIHKSIHFINYRYSVFAVMFTMKIKPGDDNEKINNCLLRIFIGCMLWN